MRTLVLFTRDLRLHDHPALTEAVRASEEVVPLFVLDPRLLRVSPNRHRFLLESLHDLDRRLQEVRGRLFVREGDVVARAISTAVAAGCTAVFVTADATPIAADRERRLEEATALMRLRFRVFPGNAVVEPGDVAPDRSDHYRIFTPYHRAWAGHPWRAPLPAPSRVRVPADLNPGTIPDPRSVRVDALDLPPGGETAGRRRFETFLRIEADGYAQARNDLAGDCTSRLSPYVRFGCLSANDVVHRAVRLSGADGFVRQLAWRDFFAQLVAADPSLIHQDMRPRITIAPPVQPEHALERWKEGMTGIPLVDAGMRQLRREGWMHNRARMVSASFLTRTLRIPWQEGARHFAGHLVDGDPSSNSGGWQWVAGTGADPRSSRRFNPVRQAQRYDPTGVYVKRYVRELRSLTDGPVFAPWREPALLRWTGFPEPIAPVPGG